MVDCSGLGHCSVACSIVFSGNPIQYRSKVTYHLSSRFSQDASRFSRDESHFSQDVSCFSRDESRFSQDVSRFSRDESRFSRDASRFSRKSLNRSVWNKLPGKAFVLLQGFKDFCPATRFSNKKFDRLLIFIHHSQIFIYIIRHRIKIFF